MSLDPKDMQEAFEVALEDSMDRLDALADVAAPDGLAYGEDKMGDAEFLGFYQDLEHRPHPQFNVLQYLPKVAPEVYAMLKGRYDRIVSKQQGAR